MRKIWPNQRCFLSKADTKESLPEKDRTRITPTNSKELRAAASSISVRMISKTKLSQKTKYLSLNLVPTSTTNPPRTDSVTIEPSKHAANRRGEAKL
jgi:hypothetical protein